MANSLQAFLIGERWHQARKKFLLRCNKTASWVRRHFLGTALALLLIAVLGWLGWNWHGARLNDVTQHAAGEISQAQSGARDAEDRAAEHRYVSRLLAAQVAMSDLMNSVRAFQSLNDCDQERRNWAWKHLHYRLNGGSLILNDHNGGIRALAVSWKGDVVATCGENHDIRLWDAVTGAELRELKGHAGAVNAVAFHPDGYPYLVSASDDATVRLWDADTGKQLAEWRGHEGSVTALAFTHDPDAGGNEGNGLVWSGGTDGTLRRWKVHDLQYRGRPDYRGNPVSHGKPVVRLASNATDGWIRSVGVDGDVKVWNPKGVESPERSRRGYRPLQSRTAGFARSAASPTDRRIAMAWLPDGSLLTGGEDGSVLLWKGADGDGTPASCAIAMTLPSPPSPSGGRRRRFPEGLLVSADARGPSSSRPLERHPPNLRFQRLARPAEGLGRLHGRTQGRRVQGQTERSGGNRSGVGPAVGRRTACAVGGRDAAPCGLLAGREAAGRELVEESPTRTSSTAHLVD